MISVDYPADCCPKMEDIVVYQVRYSDILSPELLALEDKDVLLVITCDDGLFIVSCESDPLCIPDKERNWRQ